MKTLMRSPLACLFFLSAIVLVTLRNVDQLGFLMWDDNYQIFANPGVAQPSWEALKAFWLAPYQGLYVPLVYTVWMSLALLTREVNAAHFHGLNLLIHLASVVLLWRFLVLVFSKLNPTLSSPRLLWAAAVGALFFAIHPIQMEAVAWASGLRDTLCVLFGLLHLISVVKEEHFSVKSVVFYLLSVLSKPSLVLLPLFGVLWLWKRQKKISWIYLPVFSLIAFSIFWITKWIQHQEVIETIVPWFHRPLVALTALSFYVKKLAWPNMFGPDYGLLPTAVAWNSSVILTLLALLLSCLFAWKKKSYKNAYFLLPVALVLIGLLPVLGLVSFKHQDISIVADRYVYFSMIAVGFVVCFLLLKTNEWTSTVKKGLTWTVLGLLLATCSVLSVRQVNTWENNEAFIANAIAVNPKTFSQYYNWAIYQKDRNNNEAAKAAYLQALANKPDFSEALSNLVQLYLEDTDLVSAEFWLKKAAELQMSQAFIEVNWAVLEMRRNNFTKAKVHFESAVRLNSKSAAVRHAYAAALNEVGRIDEAIAMYQSSRELEPYNLNILNDLGVAYAKKGRYKEAFLFFSQCLDLHPNYDPARQNLLQALGKL